MEQILPPFFGTKVVTALEMARLDQLAIKQGCSEEKFIEEAGRCIAKKALELIEEFNLPKRATLLIGKGNKGADTYATGMGLIDEGFQVVAYAAFSKEVCSKYNQVFGYRFMKKRGQVYSFEKGVHFEKGLLIDGLLGTGFQGKVEGQIASLIELANGSRLPILSVDVPSGLDGTTGEVKGSCIKAASTVILGMAKSGLFLREGWHHTGTLTVGNFGLPKAIQDLATATAFLPDPAALPLPEIHRSRHKYEAGYVIGFAGSSEMRGAPKMASLAALRSGAGIVRLFHKGEIGECPMEVIAQKWEISKWRSELKRATAVFVGPGVGLKEKAPWLKTIDKPILIDADLLQEKLICPKNAILTPHRGEMLRLLGLKEFPYEEEFLARCEKFAERKKVVLILKGAPTWIFSHGKPPLIIARGDPGMATAGSGDVLTGVISALLSQKMPCVEAAVTGTYIHAIAGEKAAIQKTSYGLIARDLIECLPEAFRRILDTKK